MPKYPQLPDGSLDWLDMNWFQKLERRITEGRDVPRQMSRQQEVLKATELAKYMAEKFYPEVRDFKVLNDDLYGILLQIDNMLTGLKRADA